MMRTTTTAAISSIVAVCGLALTAHESIAQGSLGEPFPAVLELADLDGEIGFRLVGIDVGDRVGRSVAGVGDFNGDGIDDVIVSAERARPGGLYRAGEVYIVFGRDTAVAGGFPAELLLASLDGSNGLRIDGAERGDETGQTVAAAGDVNGDGIDDAIIGAPGRYPFGIYRRGKAYVVFGRDGSTGPSLASISLADIDGENGFAVIGTEIGDGNGAEVSGVGDVNSDGVDDVITGATGIEIGGVRGAGEAYVVFGRDNSAGVSFEAEFQLSTLDPTTGFVMQGSEFGDAVGRAVAGAGDFNGDGTADIILGAPGRDYYNGESYVVFGTDTPPATPIVLDSMASTRGVRLETNEYGLSGLAVSSAGDLNGDGIDDVVVGATNATIGPFRNGVTHVVFGRAGGFQEPVDLDTLDGQNGFRLAGAEAGDGAGHSVSCAGDVNGDGMADLLIGAPYTGRTGLTHVGDTYLVFGRPDYPALVELGDLDGEDGFRIAGIGDEDSAGFSVAAAGDVNADGVGDIIIGMTDDQAGGPFIAGEAYVIFGRRPCAADLDGDGELTIFDFLTFQNLFDATDPRADFDGDGEFTIFDFLAFQNAFDAGCD